MMNVKPIPDPLVTIGIPTYNRARLLPRAVESALNQTYKNIEVIVSDNASTDETAGVLAGYKGRVRVITQTENVGVFPNWQACLDAAKGRYFTLLSDDDWIEPSSIEPLVRVFEGAKDDVAFVYGRMTTHYPDGSVIYGPASKPSESTGDFLCAYFSNERSVPTGASLYRTEEVKAAGGFIAPIGVGPFMDIGMTLSVLLGKQDRRVVFVDAPIFNYVVHPTSFSSCNMTMTLWVKEALAVADFVLGSPALSEEYKARIRRVLDVFLVAGAARLGMQTVKGTPYLKRFTLIRQFAGATRGRVNPQTLGWILYGYFRLLLPNWPVFAYKKLMRFRARN